MADTDEAPNPALPGEDEAPPTAAPAPRRSMGHRGADVRDTVAEMTARAHEISLEAGSKMTAVMRDVINAASGLAEFAIESARDLVQYMVRRGQMSQEDGERLLREAEEAQARRVKPVVDAAPATPVAAAPQEPPAATKTAAKRLPEPAGEPTAPPPPTPAPTPSPVLAPAPTAVKQAPAAKKAPAAKATAKAAVKAPAAKARAVKRPAAKAAPATKAAAKKAPARKR